MPDDKSKSNPPLSGKAVDEKLAAIQARTKDNKGRISWEDAKMVAEMLRKRGEDKVSEDPAQFVARYNTAMQLASNDRFLSDSEIASAREAADECQCDNSKKITILKAGDKSQGKSENKAAHALAKAYIDNIKAAKTQKEKDNLLAKLKEPVTPKSVEEDKVLQAMLKQRDQREVLFDTMLPTSPPATPARNDPGPPAKTSPKR